MFDGMPDQFYQFLAAAASRGGGATAAATLPLPLSFSLHHHHHHHHGGAAFPAYPPPPPAGFDSPPFSLSPPQQGLLSPPPHLLHHAQLPLQLQQSSHKHEDKEESTSISTVSPSGFEVVHDAWSNDEVLALLRIRSSMDNNWFPDFIWDYVSRKLAELGFKRSAEKCKQKFEEETRSFNSSTIINTCSSKNNNVINNYRLFGELEELCNNNPDHHHDHHHDHEHDHQSPPNPDHEEADDHEQDHETLISHKDESPKSGHNEVLQEQEEDKTEQEMMKLGDDEEDNTRNNGDQSVDDSEKTEENTNRVMKKRKRQKKFEMFKGFCETIVNKMMAQQEQLHCKILHDMIKRDEEKVAKEEAWKKREVERIQKEMEVRAHELAIAGDRQAKILDVLNKITSSNSSEVQSLGEAIENLIKVPKTSSNSSVLTQDSVSAQPTSSNNTTTNNDDQNPTCLLTQDCPNIPTSSPNENLPPQSPIIVNNKKLATPISSLENPNLLKNHTPKLASNHTSTDTTDPISDIRSPENQTNYKPDIGNVKDDIGRRWPRDEVLALINIRCSLFNNNGDAHHGRESSSKGPLWERISQKMMELGYTRSAKRCKEKWENINKYFRKTKDLNKKRSIDSRTCPYFHQLNHLYSQGAPAVGTTDKPMNDQVASPENSSVVLTGVQGQGSVISTSNVATNTMHTSQGKEEGVVQVPSFDFEF